MRPAVPTPRTREGLPFLCLLLLCFAGASAQEIGEVRPVDLESGRAALSLDFTDRDYELILISTAYDEPDTARVYEATLSAGAASRPVPVVRAALPPLSPHDRLSRLLRAEERTLARKLSLHGPFSAPLPKAAGMRAPARRTFALQALGQVETDRTVEADLVAQNDVALAYLDTATAPDTIDASTIQALIDRFAATAFPLVNETFGAPSDVDGDGKLLFLFTPLVDEVGPFGGFFRSASTVPGTRGGDGNLADMMYISPSRDRSAYAPLLAHEYQHLVNFNQHVLVAGGPGEASWLNEALSHYTEDLVGGHVEGGNPSLLEAYFASPADFRLTNDAFSSSGIRGAAYLFLRSQLDAHGDGLATRLVQTARTGVPNVEAATGAAFGGLLEDFLLRNFLSGTGLSADPRYRYASALLTEPETGARVMPPPAEVFVAGGGSAVTAGIRPAAAGYFRLGAEGGTREVRIEAEAVGAFSAFLIPLPRDFQPRNALPEDYLPALSFDAPVVGRFTSGESAHVTGAARRPGDTEVLLRFASDGGDTLRFSSLVEEGRFDVPVLFPHDLTGTYELAFFAGTFGESLPMVGRLPVAVVEPGTGPINLPAGFFPGVRLDAPLPTSIRAGEPLHVAGTLSDPDLTRLLLQFVDERGREIEFNIDVANGRFDDLFVFAAGDAGVYRLEVFTGLSGESLPFIAAFPRFRVEEPDGEIALPPSYFSGLILDRPLITSLRAGEGRSVSGTVGDSAIEVVLLVFSTETGEEIRFQTGVHDGAFRKGIVFTPDQAGSYELDVFGGPSGGSLPHRGEFTPVRVRSTGTERTFLPVDTFDRLLLDAPLPSVLFSGAATAFSGSVTDPAITEVGLRLDSVSGGTTVGPEFLDVVDGRFSGSLSFTTDDEGTYELSFFGGPRGEPLSSVGSFEPVEVVSPRPWLEVDSLDAAFAETPVGETATRAYRLRNQGSEDLLLSEVAAPVPFGVSLAQASLPPGGALDLDLSFSPEQAGLHEAALRIRSNDPDHGLLEVTLRAEAIGGGLVGDFDGDGSVGFGDFVRFAAAFGTAPGQPGYNPAFDLDGSGTVGFGDFVRFAAAFGTIA